MKDRYVVGSVVLPIIMRPLASNLVKDGPFNYEFTKQLYSVAWLAAGHRALHLGADEWDHWSRST